jgi:beta-lactam-binding protein with PASTA domain
VLEQDPLSGEIVDTGSTVNLIVVTIETTATVPDLTCLSADRAAIVLDEAGLQMTWAGVDPMGAEDVCKDSGVRVSDWDPATGTEVPAGSVVKVWTNRPLPSPLPTAGASPGSTGTMPTASPSPSTSGGTQDGGGNTDTGGGGFAPSPGYSPPPGGPGTG